MRISKNLIFKIIVLIILLFLPWTFSSQNKATEYPIINTETVPFYQSNLCEISLYKFLEINKVVEFDIKLDTPAEIKCFGKINGGDTISQKNTIYLGTNINIDALLQSGFWLILLTFIPKSKNVNIKFKNLIALSLSFLVYFHLLNEIGFYSFYSKTFFVNISESFTIYSLSLTVFIFLRVFLEIIESRYNNLIYFFPFSFLIVGTFNSLNLNFYLLVVSSIGIIGIFKNKSFKYSSIIYIFLVIIWISLIETNFEFFDVDKVKGFISSAYSMETIIFWSLIYLLFVFGVINLINDSLNNFNIEKLKNSFLYSGSLIILFSYLSTLGPIYNFYTYYYLGLNKTAIKTTQSVAGNAWRGISSSAETVGEFYTFVIIFTILINFFISQKKLTNIEIILLVINFYGLYKSNNFSAFISGLLVLIISVIFLKINNQKTKRILSLFAILLLPIGLYIFANNTIFKESARNMIKTGLEISLLEDLSENQYGKNAIEQNRFLEILENESNQDNISSSLKFLVNKYHYSDRNYIPNITSTISTVATTINRTEKWGIFFGKYDPNLTSLLFGTGVSHLANYYYSHPTTVNQGLVLPHSSFLSYLLFFGIFGVTAFIIFYIKLILKNRNNIPFLLISLFVVINLTKNDSILYVNSFFLLIFVINFYKFKTLKEI